MANSFSGRRFVFAATLIGASLADCAPLIGQAPDRDSRNVAIPHTDTHFEMPRFETLDAWRARREHLRKQILTAAGLLPRFEKPPVRAEVFAKVEHDGYTTEKVLLETLPGYYVGGNLYRPLEAGEYPGVLVAHGHSRYGRLEHQHRSHRTVRSEEGQARENRYPDQTAWAAPLVSYPALAINFARQGYVVFSWDMVGYNDTTQTPHSFGGPREQLWSFGPLGLQLWNSTRALDFLESLPDVDGDRIGMTGASGGATQTFLLAAVDDRVKCVAPAGMVSGIMQGGSSCENAPGLRFGASNVELAAIAAPRPMILASTPVDQTRNTPWEEYPAIRAIYRLFGRSENVAMAEIDAPHNFNRFTREVVYRFFAKHLLGDPGDIGRSETEVDLGRGIPDLLALYNRNRPADALTYDELFEQWRKTCAAQIEAIDDERVLAQQLQRTLAVEWPSLVAHETQEEAIVLSRPAVGDRVPGLWFPGEGRPVLAVHPAGAAAARNDPRIQQLLRANRPVLLIDAFQTGEAVEPRNWTYRETRRAKGHYLTFNRSDDANRVQDILTGLAFLSAEVGEAELIGLEEASLWALFAAAVRPVEAPLTIDPAQLVYTDEELIERFFVPGLQRIGGVRTALRLTRSGDE